MSKNIENVEGLNIQLNGIDFAVIVQCIKFVIRPRYLYLDLFASKSFSVRKRNFAVYWDR
ncbi:hypothetical protein BCT27_20710 [Enterovibrio norvegicus]|nr:hypothetical protein BCT27_20710 [Enterovibrio norvegicus]